MRKYTNGQDYQLSIAMLYSTASVWYVIMGQLHLFGGWPVNIYSSYCLLEANINSMYVAGIGQRNYFFVIPSY